MSIIKNKKNLFITALILAVLLLSAVVCYCVANGYSPFDRMPEDSHGEWDGYYIVRMAEGEAKRIDASRKFMVGSKSLAFLAAGKDLEQVEISFCKESKTDIISTALIKEGDNIAIPDETKMVLAKPAKVIGAQTVYYATIQFVLKD